MAMHISPEERQELAAVGIPVDSFEFAHLQPEGDDLRRAIRRIEVRLEIALEKLEQLLEEAETRNNLALLAEYGRGEETGEGG